MSCHLCLTIVKYTNRFDNFAPLIIVKYTDEKMDLHLKTIFKMLE